MTEEAHSVPLSAYFWRLVYRLANSPLVIRALASLYRALRKRLDENKSRKVIYRLARLLTGSFYKRAELEFLQASRLYWRALHQAVRYHIVPCLPPAATMRLPLRVGLFGNYNGHLLTQKPLFEGLPDEIALYVFDLRFDLSFSTGLQRLAASRAAGYYPFDLYHYSIEAVAEAINAEDLDALILLDADLKIYHLVDRLNTPCLVYLCGGSDILHHDKVSFQIHAQPQAAYFVKDEHMFCVYSRAPLSEQTIYAGMVVYSPRDINPHNQLPWRDRPPLIFWHGSLYKFASPPLLRILFSLMKEDALLELAYMGRDDGGQVRFIQQLAADWGLAGRVHYEGQALPVSDEQGNINDPGWKKLTALLRQARLWPDSFPAPSGSARLEAYVAGTPSVHMGVRFDVEVWGRPQPNTQELPGLLVPQGTAYSAEAYAALCRRCLYDETFAETLIEQQTAVAQKATDGSLFWRQFLYFYQDWHSKRG